MASVYRHPSSPYWYAKYRSQDGKWVGKSTKQKKKSDALRIAHDWERNDPKVPEAVEPGTVAEYLEEYCEGKTAQGRSPKYVQRIRQLVPTVCDIRQPLSALTAREIERGLDQLGTAPASQRTSRDTVAAFLNWSWKRGYISKIHLEARRVRDSDRVYQRTVFDAPELEKLFSVTQKSKDTKSLLDGQTRALLYRTIYECALRKEETRNLTFQDIVYPRKSGETFLRVQGKGGSVVELPLTEGLFTELINHFDRQGTAKGPIFHFSYDSLVRTLHSDMKAAGLPIEVNGRVRDIHALRKTRITDLANAGVPAHLLQTFARHADVRLTLETYAEAKLDGIRKFL